MSRLFVRRGAVLAAALPLLAVGIAHTPAPALSSTVPGDFNGDGRDELVMPVSLEDLTGTDEGALHVLPGTAAGPRARGNQLWSKASPSVPNDPANGERFAATTAVGDFDGDGYGDIAIASPNDIEDAAAAGAVYTLAGSPFGSGPK